MLKNKPKKKNTDNLSVFINLQKTNIALWLE